ncbi:uncharacterized protein LOC117642296 [Thrips palmi]|uniref:Uncharacterized protein LOC117642296 n=1 Tax=Thrips palmi TaxID=161013 RepID=A0A6P8YH22_THRPL|nr:uncharacterized protein LOC117642296 [Thrips palmi]
MQSLSALLLLCVAATLTTASPMPGDGDTKAFGGGNLRSGNVGVNHNFGDRRNTEIGGGVGYGPGSVTGNIRAQTDVWQSRDGNSRVFAGAGRSQVLSGPGRGQGENSFNVGFQRRF